MFQCFVRQNSLCKNSTLILEILMVLPWYNCFNNRFGIPGMHFLCSLARNEPQFTIWRYESKFSKQWKWRISCHSKLLSTCCCWHGYECCRMPLGNTVSTKSTLDMSGIQSNVLFPLPHLSMSSRVSSVGPSWMNVRPQRAGKSPQLL